jgi:N-acetylneuraminate synthase
MPRPLVIAEAGVNHNGSLEMAKALIDAAADAGADAVKFQTFRAEHVVSRTAEKAAYQKKTTDQAESQREMLARLQLDEKTHVTLRDYCVERGIQFLSTPFDSPSLDFLVNELDIEFIKFSSGDLTNGPLLLRGAKTGKPIILSTGMGTLDEIESALEVIAFGYVTPSAHPSTDAFKEAYQSDKGQQLLQDKIILLHATTEYPAPIEEVNLRAITGLKEAFGIKTGLSDHSSGISAAIAAVALEACMIEKHFTLDRNLPGPDHKASLEPNELSDLVAGVETAYLALGSPHKEPTVSELANIPIVRRSLVAATEIKLGEPFTEENLTIKRPGNGLSPMLYWQWLGREATENYAGDDLIKP